MPYRGRIWQKRFFRRLADLPRAGRFASEISDEQLPVTCKKHQSLLRRKLGNSDPQLQENKVENLKIACPTIDGILIKPGQTFSFWRQLGEATGEKGYCEGMQLSQGEVVRGVGGGLCQLANLLYWMALHTPLEIAERHHHSFDPFPDENRVLPFDGISATQHIRQNAALPHQPYIIALTANALKGDRERFLAAGMNDYLSKPVRLEELSAAINRCSFPLLPSPEIPAR